MREPVPMGTARAPTAIVEPIRAEQTPGGSLRVTFTLDEGWDTG